MRAGDFPPFQKAWWLACSLQNIEANKELIRCVILSRIIFGEEHWKCAQALATLAYGYLTLRGTLFPSWVWVGEPCWAHTQPHWGWGWPGEDPSHPQHTARQEKGKPMAEAGSRMGVLEIKIIMRERRQRTEGWRTKWGRGSGASEEIEESGRPSQGNQGRRRHFRRSTVWLQQILMAERSQMGWRLKRDPWICQSSHWQLVWQQVNSLGPGRAQIQEDNLGSCFWNSDWRWGQLETKRKEPEAFEGDVCLNRGKADAAPLSLEGLLSGSVEGGWASSSEVSTLYEQPQQTLSFSFPVRFQADSRQVNRSCHKRCWGHCPLFPDSQFLLPHEWATTFESGVGGEKVFL